MRIGCFTCFFSITLLTILCFSNIPAHSKCLKDQKSLLLQLKKNINFDPNSSVKLVNWTQSNDCCQWMGVTCDQSGHVIGLDLNNESISGEIDHLFSLQYLESLNLAHTNFNFTQIPSGIGNLTNLTYLNLSNAGFGGQIPIGLSLLTRLVVLDLSTIYFERINSLEIGNPNLSTLFWNHSAVTELYLDGVRISANGSEWGQAISSSLPNLRILSLSNCYISGPIDSSLQNLQFLSEINLNSNNLFAPIPDFFANFTNLMALSLSSCNLFGIFPPQILQVKTLQTLDLIGNEKLQGWLPKFHQNGSLQNLKLTATNFSGILPDSIGNLKKLSWIEISKCSFNGPIPNTMGNLTQLVYLDLSYNSFDGSIPSSLFSLPSLKEIHISNNQFREISRFSNGSLSPLDTLDLSSNEIEGPIPPYFFDFQMLVVLSLSFNNFSGTIQLESFKRLQSLNTLDISHNNLSVDVGVNISSFSTFPQLTRLRLISCNLQKFPALMNQSTISELDLSDNKISGLIPNWIWNVGNLKYLNLSCNLLVGLQSEYNMPTLFVLDLHSNQLRGEIPLPPIGAFYMDYSRNNFSSIPLDIGNNIFANLFFSLSNNMLSGPIPQSICNGRFLHVLDLSNNRLSGTIPQCMIDKHTQTLDVLNLQNNNFTGNIRGTFPEVCRVMTLDLSGNHLEGEVPKSLVNCAFMEVLNLGTNNINGNFPCFLTNLSSLRILILRSNKFQGNIHCRGIHRNIWPKLQIIDLAVNNFTGILPPKFFLQLKTMMDGGKAQLLNYTLAEFTNFGNKIYYQDSVTVVNKNLDMKLVKILTIFTAIDLSRNSFEGELPDAIGDLKSLYVLNLSHNGLTGSIPSSIGNLKQLGSLDLSWNKINGSIPKTLASLTFLSVLNLSYNQLVGMIPTGPQLQTFSETSFEGNKGLCGAPLIASCGEAKEPTGTSTPTSDEDEINWVYIAVTLGYAVGLGAIVGPLLYWKRWRECYYRHVDRVILRILHHHEKRATHQRRRDNKNLIRRRQHL